jgi:hypothetical protein
MLQITQTGIQCDERELGRLREEFSDRDCIRLPQLIAPALRDRMVRQVATARFVTHHHHDAHDHEFAQDMTIHGAELVLHQFHLLLNSPKLFQYVQFITACPVIGCFSGRIYRTLPNSAHYLNWHDDSLADELNHHGMRLIGLSLNISSSVYSGGTFQIRKKGTHILRAEVTESHPGDAHLFRIGADLEHRLTPLQGRVERVAAAGWFMDKPDSLSLLKSFAIQR